jgi:hypothetical protein
MIFFIGYIENDGTRRLQQQFRYYGAAHPHTRNNDVMMIKKKRIYVHIMLHHRVTTQHVELILAVFKAELRFQLRSQLKS